MRTTEELLRLVPMSLREGALALGATRGRAVFTVVLPAALPGIITGILLAFARIAGETAPLLFTAFSNRFFTTALTRADRVAHGAGLHLRHLAVPRLAPAGVGGRAGLVGIVWCARCSRVSRPRGWSVSSAAAEAGRIS